MAPAQVIEAKDLPPEVLAQHGPAAAALPLPAIAPALPAVASAAPIENPPVHGLPSARDGHVEAMPAVAPAAPVLASADAAQAGWEQDLESQAIGLLQQGREDVWDVLTRRFESRLILAALGQTRGRRIEAAQKLGIGRNTITRKIQELGLE